MGDELVLLVGTKRTPKETLETIGSGMGIKAGIKELSGTLWSWRVKNGPLYTPSARSLHPSESRMSLEHEEIEVNQIVLLDISRWIDWNMQMEQVVFGVAAFLTEESGDILLQHNFVGKFVMRQKGKLHVSNDGERLPVGLRALFPEPYVLSTLTDVDSFINS